MKIKILIITLLAVIINSSLKANTMYTAEVIASSLNVRSIPNNEGRIIGSLYRGQIIVVEPMSSEWVKTSLDGNIVGYVSSIYLKMINTGTTTEFKPIDDQKDICKPMLSNIKLSIEDVNMRCRDSFEKNGYDSCSARFEVNIESKCLGIADININCGAEFKYDIDNDYSSYETEKSSLGTIYMDKGFGTTAIDVELAPSKLTEPIIKVELINGVCSVLDVKNYD